MCLSGSLRLSRNCPRSRHWPRNNLSRLFYSPSLLSSCCSWFLAFSQRSDSRLRRSDRHCSARVQSGNAAHSARFVSRLRNKAIKWSQRDLSRASMQRPEAENSTRSRRKRDEASDHPDPQLRASGVTTLPRSNQNRSGRAVVRAPEAVGAREELEIRGHVRTSSETTKEGVMITVEYPP